MRMASQLEFPRSHLVLMEGVITGVQLPVGARLSLGTPSVPHFPTYYRDPRLDVLDIR